MNVYEKILEESSKTPAIKVEDMSLLQLIEELLSLRAKLEEMNNKAGILNAQIVAAMESMSSDRCGECITVQMPSGDTVMYTHKITADIKNYDALLAEVFDGAQSSFDAFVTTKEEVKFTPSKDLAALLPYLGTGASTVEINLDAPELEEWLRTEFSHKDELVIPAGSRKRKDPVTTIAANLRKKMGFSDIVDVLSKSFPGWDDDDWAADVMYIQQVLLNEKIRRLYASIKPGRLFELETENKETAEVKYKDELRHFIAVMHDLVTTDTKPVLTIK